MKDYYKILGVKPDAFSEEIHARWIQLMRKLHPDMGKVEETELEKVREVNEAYGILKDPFFRGQYDLRRTYQRKKRTMHLQRVLVPPAILIILLIFGIIIMIMQRPRAVPRLESSTVPTWSFTETNVDPPPSNQINQTRHTNDINGKNRIIFPQKISAPVKKAKSSDEVEKPAPPPKVPKPGNFTRRRGHASTIKARTNETTRTNQTNERNGINEKNQINQTNEINETNPRVQPNPTRVLKDRKVSPLFAKARTSVRATKPAQSQVRGSPAKPINPNPTNQRNEINQTKQINQINRINQINGTNEINQADQTNPRPQPNEPKKPLVTAALSVPTEPDEPNQTNQPNKINGIYQTNEKNEINETNLLVVQLKKPSLIATETEIQEFFAQYEKRYALKDTDGFLSLFSRSAVQNERYGFREIKEIYSEFFTKSLRLQYDIEDMRIQIYQNAAEISGRYKIVQTVSKGGKTKTWRGGVRWILIREDGALKVRFLDFRAEKSD